MLTLAVALDRTFSMPQLSDEIEAACGVRPIDITYADGRVVLSFPDGPLDQQAVETAVLAHESTADRTALQTLRDLRQMGRSSFMALSAAERDRLMYDAMTAVTVTLLAILRDEG